MIIKKLRFKVHFRIPEQSEPALNAYFYLRNVKIFMKIDK